MAVFPTTNLSLRYVCMAFGFVKARLSTLCAGAKSGGKSGYAFNIVENGSNAQDGTLIEGASPHWNIWSTNQPGFWWIQLDLSDFTRSKLRHRLRYDSGQKYYFSLGSFQGHNMNAKAPSMSDDEIQIDGGTTEVNVTFTVAFNFGNYDWRIASDTHQYYKIVCVKKDFPEVILGETAVTALPSNDGISRQMNLPVRVSNNPNSYGTTKPVIGYAKCYLCKSDGSQLVEMPNMSGTLNLNISQTSTISGNIYINGDLLITNKLTGGVVDKVTFEHDAIKFSPRLLRDLESETTYRLQSVSIRVRNKVTGSYVLDYSRPTLSTYVDNPKSFTSNKGGQTTISYEFVADLINSGFNLASNGQECIVNFYYVV